MSRFPGIPSGPVALFSFIFSSRLRTPALDTVILGMGFGQTYSVRGCGGLGLEKTLVKNALNMLALVSGSWISVWPDFRSDVCLCYLFCCF